MPPSILKSGFIFLHQFRKSAVEFFLGYILVYVDWFCGSDLFIFKSTKGHRHPGVVSRLDIELLGLRVHKQDRGVWREKVRFRTALSLHPDQSVVRLISRDGWLGVCGSRIVPRWGHWGRIRISHCLYLFPLFFSSNKLVSRLSSPTNRKSCRL